MQLQKRGNKKAITLVELVVVITILAILWTISMISLQSYIKESRNATRTTNVSNIKKALGIQYVSTNVFPTPDWNLLNVTYSWATVWNQWYFSDSALRHVRVLSKVPLDPLTNQPYTYSVTENNSEYEIATIYEDGWLTASHFQTTHAANSSLSAYVSGNYNWIIATAQTGSTTYILAVPSIINNDINETNLINIIDNKSLVFNWYSALPDNHEWSVSVNYTPNSDIVIFEWSKTSLRTSSSKQTDILRSVQNAYTWSFLADNSNIKALLESDVDSNDWLQSSHNILNNMFGWNLWNSWEVIYAQNDWETDPLITEEEEEIEENIEIDSNAVVPFQWFWVWFGWGSAIPFNAENPTWSDIWVQSADLIMREGIEYSWYYDDIKSFDADAFDQLQQKLSNSQYAVYWLVDWWQESWFSVTNIQKIIDSGRIPVFSYWYFWDGMTWLPIQQEQDDYLVDAAKFRDFLKKLDWTKFVLMEPEFNKDVILWNDATEDAFSEILWDAIDIIKDWNTNTYFSLTMTDTWWRKTYENHCTNASNWDCSYWDETRWNQSERIYNNLIDKLDFISFQEMVSQYSRYSANPWTWSSPNPLANTDATMWIENLDQRIVNFTKYLKAKYNKPVFLPYITVMTDTWVDSEYAPWAENFVEWVVVDDNEITPNGWLTQADDFYSRLSQRHSELESEWMFWYAVMSLFDNPAGDVGWFQYFMNNEYKKWIISTSAVANWVDFIRPNWDLDFKWSIIDNIFR